MKQYLIVFFVLLSLMISCDQLKGDKGDPGPPGEGFKVYSYTGILVAGDNTISTPTLTIDSFVRILYSDIEDANNFSEYNQGYTYDFAKKTITLHDFAGDIAGRTYKILIYVPGTVQVSFVSESKDVGKRSVFKGWRVLA